MTLPGWTAHRAAIAAGRGLRVVNFHTTPAGRADALRETLRRWTARAVAADLADLDAFFAAGGRWPDARPRFLAVFYEGYADHAAVAAPVLAELGVPGWFAVCTGFVQCPVAEQEAFARSHFIAISPEETDGRRLAMTWDEIAGLSRDHVVFPHTASHDGIAETVTDADLDREVREPWRLLQQHTDGRAGAAFAWMGGTPYGASAGHDRAVRDAGIRYVVSNTMIQRIAR
ncbi:polysaccharide deacetylase family protein [Jatrophihabitans sp. YIM 134969]